MSAALAVLHPADPGSHEWLQLITASKIPSILGISRYKSQYALWHEMAGNVDRSDSVPEALQDDWDYGHAAELAARQYWLIKNPGWRLSQGEVQYTRSDIGFPNAATIDGRGSRGRARRIVEKKTARDRQEWGDDGSGDVPIDYAAQVIFQQFITGWEADADIVVWFQFGKPQIYHVRYDAEVAATIVRAAQRWHDSLRADTPPPLDDTLSTYETVRALHPDIDGSTAEINPALAADYLQSDRDLKAAKSAAQLQKNLLLDAMGNAQYAFVGKRKVADRRPGRGDSVSLYPCAKTDPTDVRFTTTPEVTE